MEETILQYLLINSDYFTKIFPFLKVSQFQKIENVEIFKLIQKYFNKFEKNPRPKEIFLLIQQNINNPLKEKVLDQFKKILKSSKISNFDFLLSETEKYIQKTELIDAIYKSAEIIEKNESFEGVLNLIEKALQINFDYNTGIDYTSDTNIEERYNYYHDFSKGINLGIRSLDEDLNRIKNKTLNIILGASHSGKSAFLVSSAASALLQKKNILFLTLEMSEQEIAKRIDSNLLGISTNEIKNLKKEEYLQKFKKIQNKLGKLVIKEYSAGTFSTLKLKSLMNDLEAEKNFKPDIIIIDYLTLMASSRVSLAKAGNSYTFYKLIAEELHGFAKKENLPIISASQLNRGAYSQVNAGLDAVSDSLGIIMTADVVIAILNTDELREEHQILAKILKNRNTGKLTTRTLGVDFERMRFFDVDQIPNFKKSDSKPYLINF